MFHSVILTFIILFATCKKEDEVLPDLNTPVYEKVPDGADVIQTDKQNF